MYCIEALEIQNDFIDLYYFLGVAQMKLEKIHEAITTFNSYLELYYNFNNLDKIIVLNYYSLSYINTVYSCLSELYIKNQDYINAMSALLKIDENKYNFQEVHENLIDSIIKLNEYKLLLEY